MTKNDNAKEINTYFEQKNATTTIHGFLRGSSSLICHFFTINGHVHFVKRPKAWMTHVFFDQSIWLNTYHQVVQP